jgi:hypothetical protein
MNGVFFTALLTSGTLLLAATLKLESGLEPQFSSYMVFIEPFLAIFAVAKYPLRIVRLFFATLFLGMAFYVAHQMSIGNSSCGCFGSVNYTPGWVVLGFDLGMSLAWLSSTRIKSADLFTNPSWKFPVFTPVLILVSILLIGIARWIFY